MSKEFDYIIIGAGSAGGILADKLTRSGQYQVLLLEAGGTHKNMLVDMPAGWGQMLYDKKLGWGHETEPEEWAGGRRLKLPRGKVLGGCSSTNGLLYVRGHKYDFDDWVAAGCEGWGWDDLLPHFIDTEDQHVLQNPKLHGKGGALTANKQPLSLRATKAMVEAAIEAGHKRAEDFNDGEPDGAGYWQVNISDGKRTSVARRAIEPAMKRSNLTVQTGALVHKINISADKRATGVSYQVGKGAVTSASAKREVLLCAGALNSPQILMLSGIGPAQHLQEKGIAVVHDAPGVGQNLQDHATTPMCWELKDPSMSLNTNFQGLSMLGSVVKFLFKKQGPLTIPATDFGMYFKSSADQRMNDIQAFGTPISGDSASMESDDAAIKPDAMPGMTIGPTQVRPYSRGWVKLRSANPSDLPVIQMNYLQDERDRQAFLNAIRQLRLVAAQPALAPFIKEESRPGIQVQSDEALLEWIKKYITSVHHAVGTVKMGRADDPMAPLTPDLKVKGIQGLRVVDTSVMPNITSGNTNAPAVAIGSKAAEMILAEAQR